MHGHLNVKPLSARILWFKRLIRFVKYKPKKYQFY